MEETTVPDGDLTVVVKERGLISTPSLASATGNGRVDRVTTCLAT
jgi:hypothetical protein